MVLSPLNPGKHLFLLVLAVLLTHSLSKSVETPVKAFLSQPKQNDTLILLMKGRAASPVSEEGTKPLKKKKIKSERQRKHPWPSSFHWSKP